MSIRENPSSVDSVLLDVEGMKCGACVKSVEQTLESQKNVLNASVNLVERTALIDVKEKAKNLDQILLSLTNRGFPAKERVRKESISSI